MCAHACNHCRHKTEDTYGSVVKWLAPGTKEALRAYLQFDTECKTLLVPPRTGTRYLSVHHALVHYWKELGFEGQGPKVNLVRKMFHVRLLEKASAT